MLYVRLDSIRILILLGVSFLKFGASHSKLYKILAIFSSIGPIGILFGLFLQNVFSGSATAIISTILISFAAGTFLYIAIMELLADEFRNVDHNNKKKLGVVLSGFTFMAVIAVFL